MAHQGLMVQMAHQGLTDRRDHRDRQDHRGYLARWQPLNVPLERS